MQCCICNKDSVGEVCNSCIRAEQVIFNKEWTYKEGLLVKKTEDFKATVSNARVNGIAAMSTSASGTNSRVDSFNHYIGYVQGVVSSSFNGKPAPAVHIKSPTGLERYLIFPQIPDEGALNSAVTEAKAKMMGAGGGDAAGGPSAEVQEKLNKLNLLKANGILSEDEYQKEKAKLGL